MQRSIESYGLGQSGYTAGRHHGDHALERQLEDHNLSYEKADEQATDLDDRFTGRGGTHWEPSKRDQA